MRWLWREYGDDPAETDVLEHLVRARLAGGLPHGPDDTAVDLGADAAFLEFGFGSHLRNYRAFAGKYGFAFAFLSIVGVAAGVISSGIAAGWSGASRSRWAILVLGLLVALAAAINQVWRPGEKSVSRMRGANALRNEGWAFVHKRGRYRLLADDREAFGLFVDEVFRIVGEAAVVDEAHVQGPEAPR